MTVFPRIRITVPRAPFPQLKWARPTAALLVMLAIAPGVALAQAGGSPFDTGFTALQTLFTGTIAKVASIIAIVIGGYAFAHGEPGAKKVEAIWNALLHDFHLTYFNPPSFPNRASGFALRRRSSPKNGAPALIWPFY